MFYMFAIFVLLPFTLMVLILRREEEGLVGFGLFALVLSLAIYAGLANLIGPAASSAVKTFNKDCGKQYQIETLVNRNFFCK